MLSQPEIDQGNLTGLFIFVVVLSSLSILLHFGLYWSENKAKNPGGTKHKSVSKTKMLCACKCETFNSSQLRVMHAIDASMHLDNEDKIGIFILIC